MGRTRHRGEAVWGGPAAQEKQKASQREIEELSEKVNALELEKRQLQKALELATSKAQVRGAARGAHPASREAAARLWHAWRSNVNNPAASAGTAQGWFGGKHSYAC